MAPAAALLPALSRGVGKAHPTVPPPAAWLFCTQTALLPCSGKTKLSEGQRGKQRCWQLCYREEIKFSFTLLHILSGATAVCEVPLAKSLLLLKDFKFDFKCTVGPILSLCLLKGQAHLGVSDTICTKLAGKKNSQSMLLLINFENLLLRNFFNNPATRRAVSAGS